MTALGERPTRAKQAPVQLLASEVWDFATAECSARRRTIQVGRVRLTPEGRISPLSLEVRISVSQQRLLRVLLEDYPRYAPWSRLLRPGWADNRANRAVVRKALSDLRWAISDLEVWIVAVPQRGYQLVAGR